MTKVSVSLADVGAAMRRTANLYQEKLADAHQRLNQSNSILDYIEERYPAIFTEAYEVIVNHKPPPPDLSKVRLKTPEELEQEGL